RRGFRAGELRRNGSKGDETSATLPLTWGVGPASRAGPGAPSMRVLIPGASGPARLAAPTRHSSGNEPPARSASEAFCEKLSLALRASSSALDPVNDVEQNQHDQDDQQHPQKTARPVAPAAGIRIRRDRSEQQHNQDNQQNQP